MTIREGCPDRGLVVVAFLSHPEKSRHGRWKYNRNSLCCFLRKRMRKCKDAFSTMWVMWCDISICSLEVEIKFPNEIMVTFHLCNSITNIWNCIRILYNYVFVQFLTTETFSRVVYKGFTKINSFLTKFSIQIKPFSNFPNSK